jgi:hypothetical protein
VSKSNKNAYLPCRINRPLKPGVARTTKAVSPGLRFSGPGMYQAQRPSSILPCCSRSCMLIVIERIGAHGIFERGGLVDSQLPKAGLAAHI